MIDATLLDRALETVRTANLRPVTGRVSALRGPVIRARLSGGRVGGLCAIEVHGGHPLRAEIVGVEGLSVVLSPFGSTEGLEEGAVVRLLSGTLSLAVGDGLRGRIVDPFGDPIDGCGLIGGERADVPIRRAAPDPVARPLIDTSLPTGIRAIDGLTTFGRGQRLAVMGPPGTGKSTLLAAIARHAEADVVVIGLVGERGREIREFTERELPVHARGRVVCVAATSDRPAVERALCAQSATAVAEYFRDRGRSVLLMIDSLTRTARALREIGLAAGEAPTRRGFPASIYPALPAIIERAGRTPEGDITAIYTVLLEDEGEGDPIADEVRSLTDGHVALSRKLAEAGHWPAIDPLDSLSRLMGSVTDRAHLDAAMRARAHLAKFQDIELLLQVGQYVEGSDKAADAAIAAKPRIDAFLRQGSDEPMPWPRTVPSLAAAVR